VSTGASSTAPVRIVPLTAATRLAITAIAPSKPGALPALDVRLERKPRTGDAGAFSETPAGVRIPLHLVGTVIDAMRGVALRASEAAVWEAPASQRDVQD
jgi:hypothetical protein